MTPERAKDINRRLVEAWMVREELSDAVVPDISDVSLQDAIRASEMMRDGLGIEKNPDGSTTLTCHVEPTRVRRLMAWVFSFALQEVGEE